MSVVFCPFCGKEIVYPMTVDLHGSIAINKDKDVVRKCDCSLDSVEDTLWDVAFGKMIEMMRLVVEVSEAR